MNRLACAIATAWLTVACASPTLAQVEISFPLGDYCRPGRYVPVQLTIYASAARELRLESPQAMTTRVDLHGARTSCIVPWLVLDAPASLTWRTDRGASGAAKTALRPLDLTQSIVVVAGDVDAAAALLKQLFPASPIVIRQDPTAPLPGPAAAWEMLDAIILDPSAASAMGSGKMLALAGGGAIIAVRGDQPPIATLKWESIAGHQVLRPTLAGPRDSLHLGVDQAYSTIANWSVQFPVAVRHRFLLLGAIVAVVILGVAITIRRRWMPLIAIAVSAALSGGMCWWWSTRPMVMQRSGDIYVLNHAIELRDTWLVQASPTPTSAATLWAPALRPMLRSSQEAAALRIELICADTGAPQRLSYELSPRHPLVLLSRTSALPAATSALIHPLESCGRTPLTDLAREVYQRSGWTIAAGPAAPPAPASALDEAWPPVAVRPPKQPE